jgi:hypothetical protein
MFQLAAAVAEKSESAISPLVFGVGVFGVLVLLLLIVTRFDADR